MQNIPKKQSSAEMEELIRQYKELEEQFYVSAQQTGTVLWTMDVTTHTIYQSKNSGRHFCGCPEIITDVPEGSHIRSGFVHPEDVETVRSSYARVFAGEQEVTFEARFRNEYGDFRWKRICYTNIRDGSGRVLRAIGTAVDISEQVEKERQYRKELTYRDAILSATFASYTLNLTANRLTDGHARYSGLPDPLKTVTADEFFGRLYEGVPEGAREDYIQRFNRKALLDKSLAGEKSVSMENQYLVEPGQLLWSRTLVNLLQNPGNGDVEAFLYGFDITDQKMSQTIVQTVINKRYDYFAVLDTQMDTLDVFYKTDKQGIGVPKRIANSADTYPGLVRESVIDEDQSKAVKALNRCTVRERLKSAEMYSFTCRVREPDGQVRYKMYTYSYLDRQRETYLLTRTDVHEQVLEEQAQHRKMQQLLEAANQASKAKGEFLSHMSHEMRTPLNGIRGTLDIMAENHLCSDTELLEDARVSARYLSGLINDILDMSKIDSGKLTLQEDYVDTTLFEDAIRSITEPLALEKGVAVTYAVAPCARRYIWTDKKRLEQITLNLMSNAIKYTHPGGHVRLSTDSRLKGKELQITCEVQDDGIGMSPEFLQTAFDPFTRERGSGEKGTGLGLAITKSLVQMLRGQLRFDSTPGKGTTASFTFSTHGKNTVMERPDCLPGTDWRQLRFEGKRVLLAEDHPINRKIAVRQLESLGCTVDCVPDGKQAVEMFQSAEPGRFSAILMDIMMPVMDGLTAARTIRALPRPDATAIPIIAMTANAFADDVHRSLQSGMSAHLSKPFDKERLVMTLWKCMSMKTAVSSVDERSGNSKMSLTEKLRQYGADVDGALERFVDDEELYRECLCSFRDDAEYDCLKSALDAEDVKAAFDAAHSLKGVAGNLGLTPLFTALCALVKSIRGGDLTPTAPLYHAVLLERERLAELLND